jgi:hypothetical protein
MEEEQEVNGDLGCLQKPSSSQSNVGTADDSQPILASSITRDIKEEQKINGDLECLQKPSDSPPSAVATCDRRASGRSTMPNIVWALLYICKQNGLTVCKGVYL